MKRLLACTFVVLATASLPSAAAPSIDYLEGLALVPHSLAGQTLAEFSNTLGLDARGRAAWHALAWRDGEVEIQPFRGFREEPGAFDWTRPEADTRVAVPDYAELPLMVFRIHRGNGDRGPAAGGLATGNAPGLAIDERIREGWAHAFDLAGKRWTLRASYAKGPRGKVLPGSMRLTVEGADGKANAVLGRHPGLVFREQSVLWAGDLTRDGRPDFLLRRTLITGEIDYILSLSSPDGRYAATGVTRDPDAPVNGFSSGIEESELESRRHANSPPPYAVYKLPEAKPAATVSWAHSGPMKLKGIAIYTNPLPAQPSKAGLPAPELPQSVAVAPGVKRDLVFTFGGESFRLLAEIVPTWQGPAEGPHYMPQLHFGAYGSGGGPTLTVSLQHNGVKQVLLVTQPVMDDGPMTLTAGDLDGSGRLSLSIDWMPHYNNGMNNTWTRTDEPGRLMRRVSSFQSQGC